MNLFKDILRSIYVNKIIYLFLCIQFCISIISALSGYGAFTEYNKYKINKKQYIDISHTYSFIIENENQYELSKKSTVIMDELEKSTKYKFVNLRVKYKSNDEFVGRNETLVTVSPNINKIYKLELGDDKFDQGKKQVIAGYNFKKKYKLHDKIKVNESEEFEIIGFFKEGLVFLDHNKLDDELLTYDTNMVDFGTTTFVLSEENYENTKQNILKIAEKYGMLRFESVEKTILGETLSLEQSMKNTLFFSIGIMVFSLSMFLCSLIIIINQRKRDFGIRMAYGARKIDLFFYAIGQILMVYFISLILMSILYYFGISISLNRQGNNFSNYYDIRYYFVLNIGIIILIFATSIPLMVKIFKLNPTELIKRK